MTVADPGFLGEGGIVIIEGEWTDQWYLNFCHVTQPSLGLDELVKANSISFPFIPGPPPAPSISLNATISATQNPTTHHVTINWAEPLLSSGISRYVLTVSPTAPPCASGQCFLGAAERGTQLTLNTGQRYNLTVRADNCGDTQMGTESDQLAVLLRGEL